MKTRIMLHVLRCALLGCPALFCTPTFAATPSCDARVDSVSGANPALYSPFTAQATSAPFVLEISGAAGTTLHVRFSDEPSSKLNASIAGRAGSGELEVLSGSPGSHPANSANLARWWAPVAMDAGGRGTIDLALVVPPGQTLVAGDWHLPFSLRVACPDQNAGYREQPPIAFASRSVRVLPQIGAVDIEKSVIDLGPIPKNNPEAWNNGQSTGLTVMATAPFQVRLINQELRLVNIGAAKIGPATSIPYDLQIDHVVLEGKIGGKRTVTCWKPGSNTSLQTRVVLAPLLPANAAAGRLAGRYRDEIVLSVEPLELASTDPQGAECQ